MVDGQAVYLTCSAGISLFPEHSSHGDTLIMHADLAMYKAKYIGKNNYMVFQNDMTADASEKLHIQGILRDALRNRTLTLYYQPQVDAADGSITGFEALLRIQGHSLSPASFIPVAEESGQIVDIGRRVTQEAVAQLADWKKRGFPPKPVAINFSAKQLHDEQYLPFLESLLKEYQVPGNLLCLEITESIFLEHKEETIGFLSAVKSMGISIALDDFGTGYSSLSYLSFLPVDKIKLDKSLYNRFFTLQNMEFIHRVIAIAHSLQLEVVAEGVEEASQLRHLQEGKVNWIQGYYFSPPLPLAELEKIYTHVYDVGI